MSSTNFAGIHCIVIQEPQEKPFKIQILKLFWEKRDVCKCLQMFANVILSEVELEANHERFKDLNV